MTGTITLPTTLEAFIEHQEQLIHRKLSPGEREATVDWFHIFDDIRNGDLDGAVAVEKIGYLIANADDPCLLRFLSAAREWIFLAYAQSL